MRDYSFTSRGQVATIDIFDFIGPPDGITTSQVANDLKAAGPVREIVVRINSGGGGVFEALGLYNLFRQHPARKVVKILGAALSAAATVSQAGDRVEIAEDALVMVHNPAGSTLGGDADEHRRTADVLDRLTGSLVAIFTRRTRQPEATVREWLAKETWFTAQEATQARLVEAITPALAIAASFDLSKFNPPPAVLAKVRAAHRAAIGSATTEWDQAVKALVASGVPRDQAVRQLVRTQPELHHRLLVAANQGRPRVLERLA